MLQPKRNSPMILRHLLPSIICGAMASASSASVIDTSAGQVEIVRMADGLDEPWGLAFLPDGQFLVTERKGRLTIYAPGGGAARADLSGLPAVADVGQGGLLDVMIPRDFATSREIFLSYAVPQGDGEGTALGVGRLSGDDAALQDFRLLFQMKPGSSGGRHFGSRIVEASDGTIFLTIGERGAGMPAQDLARHEGSVVHLNRDGSPVPGSPFGPKALPELYSKGHRNPQGATLDAAGQLWVVEHGAQGGDELNRVEAGRNYGWPVISYGKDYDDSKIGIGTAAAGLEQPVHYWDPSIAPSGLLIHSGRMFPAWQGDIFTGSLKFDYIARLDPDRGYAEDRIAAPETGRVRDVREGPDGAVWFLSVTDGAVYRMAPSD
jgi:aldose sugar dehydrogenase